MSLMERARSMAASLLDEASSQATALEDLRRELQRRISMESIAMIMAENPERARNEIRSACCQVFSDPAWSCVSLDERTRLVEALIDVIFGMGPIDELLEDESVTEIMVNGSQHIFYEREGVLHASEVTFESDEQVRVLIDRIISPLGRRIDESSPMVNARLPQGYRVHAVIPPISPDGPILTIRAFSSRIVTLEGMMEQGSFDASVGSFLVWAVKARKNIAVSGGTGSGKTTLLNALSCHIPCIERIITIEDSLELKFQDHPHVVRLEARPRNAEGTGEVTIRELVINALRMRPDRIIVGECRGGEALDMLQAMNTGHEGSMTTLHANSTREAIDRLITMVRYAVDLPIDAIEAQIGNAFDAILQTTRSREGLRYISEISEVRFDTGNRSCVLQPIYERPYAESEGRWLQRPCWLDDAVLQGIVSAEEVDAWWEDRSLP